MTVSSHSKLRRDGHGHHHSQSNGASADLKLFVKDVDDPHGRKRPLTVKTWATVKDVKDAIKNLLHVPPSAQRIYYGPLMASGADLPNHRSLSDAGIYRSGETIYLEVKNIGNNNSTRTDYLETSNSSPSPSSSSICTLKSKGAHDVCISKSVLDLTPKPLRRTIQQARRGLALGLKPALVLDGSGGTYFLHDARKVKVAVFKPADEEPYAENNPRGYVQQGTCTASSISAIAASTGGDLSMRAGIKPGEACLREMAAYLLDHESFSDVPMTTLAEARHPAFNSNGSMLNLNQGGASVGNHSLQLGGCVGLGSSPLHIQSTSSSTSSKSSPHAHSSSSQNLLKKVGSLQEFAHAECTMDDLSFSKVKVEEVHKIAVLDIRTMNADRNTANLLCRRNPEDPDFFQLIPIDHGYCLRTVADVCWFDWCWLDWPQLKQPVSEKTKKYILNLDIEADARMLKERLSIPERALDYFRASSKLLQEGIKSGMTLYDVAILCCRNDNAGERQSKLETLIAMADDIAKSALDNGRWHHTAASRALEQQLTPAASARIGFNNRNFSSSPVGHGHQSTRSNLSTMFKSQSSVNFTSFRNAFDVDAFEDSNACGSSINSLNPPTPMPMAQSSMSGSDSSSDDSASGGEEEEECDEWAAAFLADTLEPIHQSTKLPASSTRRQRAISFAQGADSSTGNLSINDSMHSSSTHDELSSSPMGFWHVPPSASKDSQSSSDDNDSSLWSPFASPSVSPSLPSIVGESGSGSGSGGIGNSLEMESLELETTTNCNKNPNRLVKFDMANLLPPINFLRSTPAPVDANTETSSSDHLLNLKENNNTSSNSNACSNDDGIGLQLQMEESSLPSSALPTNSSALKLSLFGGLRRSQSYSAFSFQRITDQNTDSTVDAGKSLSKSGVGSAVHGTCTGVDAEQHRQYFHKFVDLLIDREITPKVRSRQASINSTMKAKQQNPGKSVDLDSVSDQLQIAAAIHN